MPGRPLVRGVRLAVRFRVHNALRLASGALAREGQGARNRGSDLGHPIADVTVDLVHVLR